MGARWQLYVSADASTFDAFGRVLSGTVKVGQRVRVLGENYTPDDEEDMTEQTITDVWLHNTRCGAAPAAWSEQAPCAAHMRRGWNAIWMPAARARYRISVPQGPAGSWVLLGGVDASIVKTATIVDASRDNEAYICRPLKFDNAAVVKVGTARQRASLGGVRI